MSGPPTGGTGAPAEKSPTHSAQSSALSSHGAKPFREGESLESSGFCSPLAESSPPMLKFRDRVHRVDRALDHPSDDSDKDSRSFASPVTHRLSLRSTHESSIQAFSHTDLAAVDSLDDRAAHRSAGDGLSQPRLSKLALLLRSGPIGEDSDEESGDVHSISANMRFPSHDSEQLDESAPLHLPPFVRPDGTAPNGDPLAETDPFLSERALADSGENNPLTTSDDDAPTTVVVPHSETSEGEDRVSDQRRRRIAQANADWSKEDVLSSSPSPKSRKAPQFSI